MTDPLHWLTAGAFTLGDILWLPGGLVVLAVISYLCERFGPLYILGAIVAAATLATLAAP